MNLAVAYKGLAVSVIFAAVASFYYPPERAKADISLAVDKQPVWNMRAQGKVGPEPMHIDLVKRQEELLFRISYSPVKLLNNRWITLGRSNHLFSNFHLVKRLTTFNDLIHRRERYAFEWDEKVVELFAGIPEQNGVLWFKRRSGLPINFSVGEFEGLIQYQEPFSSEEIVQVRELGEVIEQLRDLTRTRNGLPKPLPYLINGSVDTAEFAHDFDQDGISDAL